MTGPLNRLLTTAVHSFDLFIQILVLRSVETRIGVMVGMRCNLNAISTAQDVTFGAVVACEGAAFADQNRLCVISLGKVYERSSDLVTDTGQGAPANLDVLAFFHFERPSSTVFLVVENSTHSWLRNLLWAPGGDIRSGADGIFRTKAIHCFDLLVQIVILVRIELNVGVLGFVCSDGDFVALAENMTCGSVIPSESAAASDEHRLGIISLGEIDKWPRHFVNNLRSSSDDTS